MALEKLTHNVLPDQTLMFTIFDITGGDDLLRRSCVVTSDGYPLGYNRTGVDINLGRYFWYENEVRPIFYWNDKRISRLYINRYYYRDGFRQIYRGYVKFPGKTTNTKYYDILYHAEGMLTIEEAQEAFHELVDAHYRKLEAEGK
ncbi:MAG: hypothetical protein IJF84_13560 [Thermoguttaceae bacterium]|nr:hypothetical protein [Thermoguttaceae bacterium]